MGKLLKVEELAVMLQCSVKSINNWYAFKKQNPDNEFAKLLPEFTQEHERGTRYWKYEDIYKLNEFRTNILTGRNGFMGSVTQKYYHKEREKN